MRTLLTILLTSLVWAIIITAFFELRTAEEVAAPAAVEQSQIPSEPTKQERRTTKKATQKIKAKSSNSTSKAVAQPEAKQ